MTAKVSIKVQPLSPTHAVSIATFTCGVKFIDAYLRQGYDLEKGNFARLFIAVDAASKTQVVGYYALHMMHIAARQTPVAISRNLHPDAVVGAAHFVNFAVRKDLQGQGIGTDLFRSALRRVKGVSKDVGIWVVVLDALNDDAERFYRRCGFETLVGNSRRLYLPVSAIA
jgi:GNAT superfamily N-acetyltransferase